MGKNAMKMNGKYSWREYNEEVSATKKIWPEW